MGGIIERHKELRQRRHRKKKLKVFKRRLAKATASEKTCILQALPGIAYDYGQRSHGLKDAPARKSRSQARWG